MTRHAPIDQSQTNQSQTAPASASRSPLQWASETVRNKPEALLLLAAGCALLIGAGRSVARSPRQSGLRRAAAPGENAPGMGAEGANGVGDRLSSIRAQAAGSISDAGSRVSEAASSLADSSTRALNRTQSSLESALDYLVQEQPLLLGALGLAAGATIGAAFPATEVENRVLGEARDQLAQAATQAAVDQLSRLRTAAGSVGDKVKEAASQHGFTSDGLKDFAHDVTDAVKSAAASPSSTQGQGQTSDPGQSPGESAHPSPTQRDSLGRSPAQGGAQSPTSGVKTN